MEKVKVTIKVDGRKLPPEAGFPFRHFVQTVEIAPDVAEELVDSFRMLAKRKPAEKDDGYEPFPQT